MANEQPPEIAGGAGGEPTKQPQPHLRSSSLYLDIKGPEWIWDCLYVYTGHRLHLRTHRNINPYVSFGRAEVWSGRTLTWNLVCTLPWSDLKVTALPVGFDQTRSCPQDLHQALETDGRTLLDKAMSILT